MKKESFHDILKQKMDTQESPPVEIPSYTDLLESLSPFFQIPIQPQVRYSIKKYNSSPRINSNMDFKEKAPEFIEKTSEDFFISKNSLTEEEVSVWNLFEKVVGPVDPAKTTRKLIMKVFRDFAKKHHPDVSQETTNNNFAYIVKVKNEMISLFEKKKSGNTEEAHSS